MRKDERFNLLDKKKCKTCNEVKPLSEYYSQEKYSKSRGHYIYYNPECKLCVRDRSYKWVANNRERRLESNRRYYNTERGREVTRINSKRRRERGTWYKWYNENRHRYDYSHKNHEISDEEWEYCREYFNYSCAYCGITEDQAKREQGQYLHKEHVDHEGANDLSNCVPACKVCNSSKYNFDFEYWYKERSYNFSQDRLDKINKWLDNDYKTYIETQ